MMLLDSLNSESVIEDFRTGASGVFPRDGSLESLRKCIFTVRAATEGWSEGDTRV